jgi:hypothetical protein
MEMARCDDQDFYDVSDASLPAASTTFATSRHRRARAAREWDGSAAGRF